MSDKRPNKLWLDDQSSRNKWYWDTYGKGFCVVDSDGFIIAKRIPKHAALNLARTHNDIVTDLVSKF